MTIYRNEGKAYFEAAKRERLTGRKYDVIPFQDGYALYELPKVEESCPF